MPKLSGRMTGLLTFSLVLVVALLAGCDARSKHEQAANGDVHLQLGPFCVTPAGEKILQDYMKNLAKLAKKDNATMPYVEATDDDGHFCIQNRSYEHGDVIVPKSIVDYEVPAKYGESAIPPNDL